MFLFVCLFRGGGGGEWRGVMVVATLPLDRQQKQGRCNKQTNWKGRMTKLTRKTKVMAAGEACKALVWPSPGLKERILNRSGFSAEGAVISLSTVPRRGMCC